MPSTRPTLLLILLATLPVDASAQDTASPPGNAFLANKKLGRGINLGNALDAPKEGEWGGNAPRGVF